jgi:hypothetical protein
MRDDSGTTYPQVEAEGVSISGQRDRHWTDVHVRSLGMHSAASVIGGGDKLSGSEIYPEGLRSAGDTHSKRRIHGLQLHTISVSSMYPCRSGVPRHTRHRYECEQAPCLI